MSLAEVPEIPFRIRYPSLGGNGKETLLQLVPFQCRMLCSPTAQTSFEETPSTAFKMLPLYVPGLGLGIMPQLVPFQCSVNVCKGIEPGSPEWPTAHMSLAEMAATPFNTTQVFPAGFGLATTLQLLPFQCSIRVCRMY